MTNELLAKAKECKSPEELLALAKENNIEMTEEEAKAKFAELHNEGELSDDELDGAAGGGCGKNKDSYSPQNGDRVRVKYTKYKCSKCGGTVGVLTATNLPVIGVGVIEYVLSCDNPNCGNKNWKIECLVEETGVFEPA